MYQIYSNKATIFFYMISTIDNGVMYNKSIKKLLNTNNIYSSWTNEEVQELKEFEYLFSCDSYEDALQNYPEHFI